MRPRQTLAFKLIATGLAFLLLALASIALTLWVTWQLEGGAAAVNEAGRMRMMSYRMALDAAAGDRDRLPAQVAAMERTLELLRSGDPSRPLFIPWNDAARAEFAAVQAHWLAWRPRWRSGAAPPTAAEVDAFVDRVDGFVAVIEQRLSHWTEVLRTFQFVLVAFAIGSAMLLFYASHRMVLDPLRRLGQGLGAIRSGDFSARVQVAADDEFGQLSAGFNSMAERLQALYGELEARVEEKTARLEVKRERLASLYEVSAFVAQAENLDALARGFVAKLRRIAAADAVALRWSDECNDRYLMLAHEGLPADMVAQEQCVPADTCHCGRAASATGTNVIPIRAEDPGQGHCMRAGFETLLTVPVRLHQRVLGEIDLLYYRPRELDDEERGLIDTLASHLAGGIEGQRVAAAQKEAAVASERSLIASELHDSIAQSLAFLKIQVGLLRDALRRDDGAAAAHGVAEIDAGVRESYADVRELLLHFRTRTNGEDIEPALRSTLQKFEHQTGLATELLIEGHGVALPADVQVQVLHVLQEALSNVRKHAGATGVRVTVQQAPEWRFEVADDGCGFAPDPPPGASHVGLRIMRERAERIGASVEVRSRPGGGTRVEIRVPHASAHGRSNDAHAADPTARR